MIPPGEQATAPGWARLRAEPSCRLQFSGGSRQSRGAGGEAGWQVIARKTVWPRRTFFRTLVTEGRCFAEAPAALAVILRRPDQPLLLQPRNRQSIPAANPRLLEDVLYVDLDGAGADPQRHGDILIPAALFDQFDHLQFPRGQRGTS